MGKKDISEKRLEDYVDVFADIVNVLAFHGNRLLDEDNLVPGPTESVYEDEGGSLRNQFRDVLKYDARGRTVISVIGLENQSTVDPDMVFRVMKYNAASYHWQIARGDTCRRPVFTLVLYFGNRPWSGPKTVMEALKVDDIAYGEYAGELIMDGTLNVYEIAFLPRETREKFASDFRIVADYFCAVREGREEEFRKDKRAFRHVRELLEFFHIVTGDRRYVDYESEIEEKLRRGEVVSMCTVMDSAVMEGRREGEREGRREGRREGKREGKRELLTKQIQNLRAQGFQDNQIEQVLALPEDNELIRQLMEEN